VVLLSNLEPWFDISRSEQRILGKIQLAGFLVRQVWSMVRGFSEYLA
jgi:hypothetical protein